MDHVLGSQMGCWCAQEVRKLKAAGRARYCRELKGCGEPVSLC